MNYQVVSMQQSHIPKLAQIERACFHAPWSEAALQEELEKGIFLVALDAGGIPVGYVGCQTVLDEAISPMLRFVPTTGDRASQPCFYRSWRTVPWRKDLPL